MEQVAPSPLPPRPTRELKMSEENDISNALAVTTHKGVGEGVTPSAPSPPTDGHNHNNDARNRANCRPSAAPTMGAVAACAPPQGQANQAVAPDGAAGP